MDLLGKVALVTGAGSGIGKASAVMLASRGAKVAVLSRTESEIRKTKEEIEAAGGKALALTADVSLEGDMKVAIDTMVSAWGQLDIVVANAGINGVWAPIDDLQPHEWDKTISVNLRGTYLTIHYAVPHLKASGGGSVVVVSSINGTRTFTTAGATAYAATKAAQLAMVQQLALELGKSRIRINAVCPGLIATNIPDSTIKRNQDAARIPVVWPEGDIPITGGKAGTSEDVAEIVTFLASDRSRHITGSPVWIDGGQSLLR
ncbi:NAD(P)-dependent dehydrogenase, short-chain alcohol dehydrogenase family [Xaviernesmea oryzae]|uniref:NAD(P)-dependent dehydrogenase, short-chain alcohol dehydrogenase family n=1 Tax=Xaviernesmea oryzae TaxID=464029 RepID=A0A1X7EKN2_9HYPH|nr:SDR family NAD(P)-dependent oxidoreductase [Xaviernesmea oryzae]SMF35413.1 NAD(P)-dependent dehydrogenase, short-chain alcohol dehydrogenase family [Xaviernesmea oryzae]